MADTTTTGTVAGYFDTHRAAEKAIDELKDAGFTSSQIGLAASGTALPTSDTRTDGTDGTYEAGNHGESFWGKVKDFFGGDGNEAEPYAGERAEGGLGTREITGGGYDANPNDVHGSLSELAVPGAHAQYFGDKLGGNDQGYLVTVSAAERAAEARQILEQQGADLGNDVDSGAYQPKAFAAADRTDADRTADAGTMQNIKLYGEVLRVHKDRVSRGDVRIRKEVHTDTQTVEVPVTREELVIERVPVSGQAAGADANAFSDREIRIPLSEERASIEKQQVLREEVRVGTRNVTDTKSFDEQVRNEELKVDDNTKVGR